MLLLPADQGLTYVRPLGIYSEVLYVLSMSPMVLIHRSYGRYATVLHWLLRGPRHPYAGVQLLLWSGPQGRARYAEIDYLPATRALVHFKALFEVWEARTFWHVFKSILIHRSDASYAEVQCRFIQRSNALLCMSPIGWYLVFHRIYIKHQRSIVPFIWEM